MIAPMVEQLAGENPGSVKVGKVNIDDNPQRRRRTTASAAFRR